MNVTICGAGQMGQAIAWAMNYFGHTLHIIDRSAGDLYKLKQKLPNVTTCCGNFTLFDYVIKKSDIIISALPYHQNVELACLCIDNGVAYCDLGGHVDSSTTINDYAKTFGIAPVFTDLGLAPGWVNIITEHGYQLMKNHKIIKIEMAVGGLPVWENSIDEWCPLRYKSTWSVDGLINEYIDDCIILENGEIKTVKGMDGYEEWFTDAIEEFYTSGGSAHTIKTMQQRGVKNCCYKTLRYHGHRRLVKWLYNKFGVDGLKKAFATQENEFINHVRDRVLINVLIECENGIWWEKDYDIYQNVYRNKIDQTFSAMQICTAFPISVVANLMLQNVETNDFGDAIVLQYEDVPYSKFAHNVEELRHAYDYEITPIELRYYD